MSNIEIVNVLSKPWADVHDIMKLSFCGRDKASYIRDDIREKILNSGKLLPICKTKYVPMNSVIEYLNLNIDYIYSMAQKEKQFGWRV